MDAELHREEVVRWRWILPVVMVLVTIALEAQSAYQWTIDWPDRDPGSGLSTTAGSISHILNFLANPIQQCVGFYAPVRFGQVPLELGLLLSTAIWWSLVGWRLDTRRRRFSYTLDYKIAWTLIYLSGLWMFASFIWIATGEMRWMGWEKYVEFYRRYGLRSWSIASSIAAWLWGAAFCLYFVARIQRLWRKSRNVSDSPLRFNYVALEWMIGFGLVAWLMLFALRNVGIYMYVDESLVIARSCIAAIILQSVWDKMRKRRTLATDRSV